jgi:hypothetical protein
MVANQTELKIIRYINNVTQTIMQVATDLTHLDIGRKQNHSITILESKKKMLTV